MAHEGAGIEQTRLSHGRADAVGVIADDAAVRSPLELLPRFFGQAGLAFGIGQFRVHLNVICSEAAILVIELPLQIFEVKDGAVARLVVNDDFSVAIQDVPANGRNAERAGRTAF